MKNVIATLTLIAGLYFAFLEGPHGPDVVNFFGAIGFLCASVWIGNILALRSVDHG